jgi:hypothetical protein
MHQTVSRPRAPAPPWFLKLILTSRLPDPRGCKEESGSKDPVAGLWSSPGLYHVASDQRGAPGLVGGDERDEEALVEGVSGSCTWHRGAVSQARRTYSWEGYGLIEYVAKKSPSQAGDSRSPSTDRAWGLRTAEWVHGGGIAFCFVKAGQSIKLPVYSNIRRNL